MRCFNDSHSLGLSFYANHGFGRGCLLGGGAGPFSLLMGLSFGRSADHGAGNSFCDGQSGSQLLGVGRHVLRVGLFAAFFGAVFAAFNHVAIGIALTFATVAAATLTP